MCEKFWIIMNVEHESSLKLRFETINDAVDYADSLVKSYGGEYLVLEVIGKVVPVEEITTKYVESLS